HIDETHSLHTACFRGLVGTLPKHTTRRAHGVLYVVYSPLSVVPWRGRVSSYPTRPSSRTVSRSSVSCWTESSMRARGNPLISRPWTTFPSPCAEVTGKEEMSPSGTP